MTDHRPEPANAVLRGVRVADFTAVVAGPYATRLMARAGADVVKIEPPEGDHLRNLPPMRDGVSAFFGALNAGKRSVALDLRSELGRDAAAAIVDWADVVVENFRPGVMARFGLDYDTLSQSRSDLVFCSVSGYGQIGPWTGRPALAAIVHATSGFDLAWSSYQPDVEAPPATGIHIADVLGASLALSGLLMALRSREITGIGRHVDVSMLDGMLSLITGEVMSAQFPGDHTTRGYPPSKTADGYVMIGAVSQRLFEALMRAIGRPELIADPRFVTNPLRWEHTRELEAIVEEWTSQRASEDVETILLEAGVPASRYRTAEEQFQNEQIKVRQTFATVEDAAGQYQIVDSPFHFREPGVSDTDPTPVFHVPALGEHTLSVLRERLGHDAAAELVAAGVAVALP
jgi:CoA:oxalate CoA-transferase